jgi:hypothetical protein
VPGAALSALGQTTIDGTNCIVFYPTPHSELARCARLLGKDHPLKATTLTVSLIGDPPNLAHAIKLSLDGAQPFQELPVKAAPSLTQVDVGMVFADMNFDGLVDFGVMTTAAAGPLGTFQWFVFDAGEKRFEFNPALSRLANPHAEVAKRRIVSERRGSPDRTDSYRWQAGKLVFDERLERACTSGRCTCRRLKPVGRKFMLLGAGPCP